MTTTHVCKKTDGQCSCGQWWVDGRAVARFVAAPLIEAKQEAEAKRKAKEDAKKHPILRGDIEKFPEMVKVQSALEGYIAQYKSRHMVSSKAKVRAEYYEYGHRKAGECGKSYLSIGVDFSPTPYTFYQAGSMYSSWNGKFQPSSTRHSQRQNWGTIERTRKQHGYQKIASLVI